MGNCSLVLLLCLTWSLFNLGTSQLPSFQAQVLLQLKRHLEHPKQLEMWYDHGTDFCSLLPSARVNITCQFNSVTELTIMGDKPSNKVSTFEGFAIPNKTLSENFSIDSFVTTLSRLSSLRVLSLVSLGIWGPLPDKIHRLTSLEYLDLSSNFLFGSIPPKFSTMVKLQSLILENNFFNGRETSWIGSLSSLSTLSLKNNQLNGPFPSSTCSITTLTVLVLSGNGISGKLPDFSSLINLQVLDLSENKLDSNLPQLPKRLVMAFLSNNSFSGEIPSQYSGLNQLQHIDLSFNKLSGAAPADLFSLSKISSLNLASNMLTGSLPHNLSCSSNLEFIDISNNRLTGGLPSCLGEKSDTRTVKFNGNCLSVDRHSQHAESYCIEDIDVERRESGEEGIGILIGITVGVAVVFVLLVLGFLTACRRCCSRGTSEQHLLHKAVQDSSTTGFSCELPNNERFISEASKLESQCLPACRSFTMEELKEATNNFNNSAVLGEGSYGKLYHGRLENGMPVAIRCLPSSKRYSIRNLRLRLDMLAKIRHPNLVGVIGHCIDGGTQDDYSVNQVFLVYEYVPNGNLRSHLSDNGSGVTLNWSERLAVLIGVAKAVLFLHTGVIPGFFNNRLKTNNILLNERGTAKLSDYGLSIISEQSGSSGGNEDLKSWQMKRLDDDVYSFGLILLESLVGSSIVAKKEGFLQEALVSLNNQDGRGKAISPIVMATSSQESLSIIISITCKCISFESWSRPSFEDILWNLQQAAQVQAIPDGQKKLATTRNFK
ncbi:hypothetical protein SLE2022_293920 [Rubroshorea leprosula]